ncbi:MAG: IS110 family transposase [Proteobacteria bacterium]|nr:IS110 family transposase [Pseudomonadota bacterium]
MQKPIAYVAVDYHVKIVTVAVKEENLKEIHDTVRMKNESTLIKKYLKKLCGKFDLKICYEASTSGYSFQRQLQSWGFECDVIAPSLIPRKPGDHRKNDFRDAVNMVQQYSQGNLSIVHPPTEEEESIRSLIRCRLAMKENEKHIKQQINAFLLFHGLHWGKTKWTVKHRQWLSNCQMRDEYSKNVLDEYIGHLNYVSARIECLDELIEKVAASDIYASAVKELRALRGIGTLTAMLLIAEITDFKRFPNPKSLISFMGLIPSENSSDGKEKGGGITKSGNGRCRKQLIESVQHYIKKPVITYTMRRNLKEVKPGTANIAIKCMHRLHKRYWTLVMKGKNTNKAKTAIAREFVGFIWAIMQPVAVCVGYSRNVSANCIVLFDVKSFK